MMTLEIFTHNGMFEQENTHAKDQQLKHKRAFARALDGAEYTAHIYDFADEPQAYTENTEVRTLLAEHGAAALPLILIDEYPVCAGNYPTNDELADLLKIGCTEIDDENSTCCKRPCRE